MLNKNWPQPIGCIISTMQHSGNKPDLEANQPRLKPPTAISIISWGFILFICKVS